MNIDIDTKDLNLLMEVADEHGLGYDWYEGTLLDNVVIYNDNVINIGGKTAEFIIIKEKYLNSWSSGLVLTLTNSIDEINSFISQFDEYED